jgi:hypothetical protein
MNTSTSRYLLSQRHKKRRRDEWLVGWCSSTGVGKPISKGKKEAGSLFFVEIEGLVVEHFWSFGKHA